MQLGSARSSNIEDRRGQSVGTGLKLGGGSIVIILLAALIGGPDAARMVMDTMSGVTPADEKTVETGALPPGSDPQADFASAVLADTEQTWRDVFSSNGRSYQEPVLVLFNGAVRLQCGIQSSAVGPFYCPLDQKVFLDLGFFRQLDEGFGAPGDFARAYVVGHEVGHHVQNLLGISDKVQHARANGSRTQGNALSVRMELQADCLAGVWAHHANARRKVLEPGDVEEGLRAAAAIGDDKLQQSGRGVVVPESFTHGSSAQRVEWLQRGLRSGSVDACDTFSGARL